MKKAMLLVVLFFSVSSPGKGLEISSCNRQHVLKEGSSRELIVKNKDQHDAKLTLPHEVYGGAIDVHTSMFAVYGSPLKLSNDNPQLMVLSIYINFTKPRLYMRRYLGGGIYEVNFSKDHRYVIADTRFGAFVANIQTGQTELRLPSEPLNIDFEKCQ